MVEIFFRRLGRTVRTVKVDTLFERSGVCNKCTVDEQLP